MIILFMMVNGTYSRPFKIRLPTRKVHAYVSSNSYKISKPTFNFKNSKQLNSMFITSLLHLTAH